MKNKVLKIIKIILPILIGVYLTWYFITNAISPEKRSFFLSASNNEIESTELYTGIFTSIENKTSQNNLFRDNFNYHKLSSYEEIENEFSKLIADEVFHSPPNSLLKPIVVNNTYYIAFIESIEPEITKEDFVNSFKNVNYFWIFLALLVAFMSHLSRAFRWKYLLEPLGLKPKLSLMYHSVMIGYIINLTIPRSGEVARAGYFSKYQNSSSEKVFGTIVVERVIDLLMFGLIFLIAIFLQTDQEQFNQIRQADSSGLPNWVFPLFLILGIGFSLLLFYTKSLKEKVIKFIKGIVEGCLTILKLKQKLAFVIHTIFIWTAYIVMLWLTALSIPEMQSIEISALFACFIAGTIAIGATPGGIGLYPIMIASALIQLYSYSSDIANSFGLLMWTTQTVFLIVLGLISLFAIKKEA